MKSIRAMIFASSLLAPVCAQDATVSVVHAVPGLGGPVDVFANGASWFSFDYGDQAGPLELAPGLYNLEVRQNGATLLSLSATLAADTDYTVIANLDAAGAPSLGAFVNSTDNLALPTSRLYVRHTAQAPAVDILLEQNSAVVATIANVSNGQEAVADVAPGNYSVRLNVAGTSNTAFGPVDVRVENGYGYAVFAAGQVATPNFQLITQRVPLAAMVTVVHGVPGLGAPVQVAANGNALFSFDFREVVGPLAVLPGSYTFDAAVNGNVVLSRNDTVARGDDVTVVAHLDGAGAPLLSAFVNDVSPLPAGRARVTVRHLAAAPAVDVVVPGAVVGGLTVPGLSNGNEATAEIFLGNTDVSLSAGGATVFGPVNFRPTDSVFYQFLALGDFNGGTFAVELIERDLTPAVPGQIMTTIGGASCGPVISAQPTSFDYGEPWLLVATGADANVMAMVNFGTSITTINGFALPIDLTAQGAPGCFLNADSFATLAVMTDSTGRVEVPYLVPTSLFGLLQPGYFQIGTFSSSNALGVVTTEYLEIR